MRYDLTDLLFRLLFSLIFLGLGAEHLFDDALIQSMIPDALPAPHLFSKMAGFMLLLGGASVLLGYQTRKGAMLLGSFLLLVTAAVHVPALFSMPKRLPEDWHWLWNVYQRSNLVKNLCLLGVCFHLINHRLGTYSLHVWLKARKKQPSTLTHSN